MCEMALMVAGAAVSAAGQMAQASAATQAANYNAKIAERNAQISENKARDALDRGKLEEQQKRYEVSSILGDQKAAMAANGVDISFGSPLDALTDSAAMGELDALTIRSNAAREAYNYNVDAANYRAESNLQHMTAKSSSTGGFFNSLSSFLTGTTKAYSTYKKSSIGAYGN